MRRISAVTRISLGLACLMVTVLLTAQGLGLLPDVEQVAIEGRRSLCEAIAIECCLAAQRDDRATMQAVARALVARNATVLSSAVRRNGGTAVVETEDHQQHWDRALQSDLPATHVTVPIYEGRSLWGSVEICFCPLPGHVAWSWLPSGNMRLIVFATGAAFLLCIPYLTRILRHLDPSRVIPARVRSTLDTLAEGVLILDTKQRIILANKAFASKVGCAPDTLQGINASQIHWSLPNSSEKLHEYPWRRAIEEGVSQTGVMLGIGGTTDAARTLAVNAMPILGSQGERRGALATFDDITVVERQNLELGQMLSALRESREQIQRQNKDLYLLATRDPLTQCLNRRSFREKLEIHWNAAKKQDTPLGFVMLDVDHFKAINDRHGHANGDEVLRQIAQSLQATVRENQLVCRYGGEEFCLLLPGLDLDQAAAEAERHRRAVEALKFSGFSVTVSLGVSDARTAGENVHELLEQADKCLYHAKRSGRNRVVRWDQMPSGVQADSPEAGAAPASGPEESPIPFQVVSALSHALAYRDMLTAEHSRQVADWSSATARGLLSSRQCYQLEAAALLHDIGKLAIPDVILLKPGPLTEEEHTIMETHVEIGAEILAPLGSQELCEIVRLHHAWFGGTPRNPAMPTGEQIPLPARILAICDAFVAMVSDRVYRKAKSCEDAFAELRNCAGTQFDPALVERFIQVVSFGAEHRNPSGITVSKHTALMIGLQIDRLTRALDTHDFERISMVAGRLAASAANDGASDIAKLASQLERAAAEDPELISVVKLTHELLEECGSLQRPFLDAPAGDHEPA